MAFYDRLQSWVGRQRAKIGGEKAETENRLTGDLQSQQNEIQVAIQAMKHLEVGPMIEAIDRQNKKLYGPPPGQWRDDPKFLPKLHATKSALYIGTSAGVTTTTIKTWDGGNSQATIPILAVSLYCAFRDDTLCIKKMHGEAQCKPAREWTKEELQQALQRLLPT